MFEEIQNVISLAILVTAFTVFTFNVTEPIITWNNFMYNIILKGLNFYNLLSEIKLACPVIDVLIRGKL